MSTEPSPRSPYLQQVQMPEISPSLHHQLCSQLTGPPVPRTGSCLSAPGPWHNLSTAFFLPYCLQIVPYVQVCLCHVLTCEVRMKTHSGEIS